MAAGVANSEWPGCMGQLPFEGEFARATAQGRQRQTLRTSSVLPLRAQLALF